MTDWIGGLTGSGPVEEVPREQEVASALIDQTPQPTLRSTSRVE